MIQIKIMDGDVRSDEKGISVIELAKSLSISLAKKVIAAKFNGNFIEINRALLEDGELILLTREDADSLNVLNHSAAHLLAQAIKLLYPSANFGVGPAIDEGFYYDVDFKDQNFTDQDLLILEKKMKELVKKDYAIERILVSYEEAIKT